MYVVRNKKTKEILSIDQSLLSEGVNPRDIYKKYDPKAMEFGKTDKDFIPAHFSIDKNGMIMELTLEEQEKAGFKILSQGQKIIENEIVDKTLQELVSGGIISLVEYKNRLKQHYSDLSFELRKRIIPDYKIQNAVIGLYDGARILGYRMTIQAFKDEYKRLVLQIDGMKSISEAEKIKPNFPIEIVEIEKKINE